MLHASMGGILITPTLLSARSENSTCYVYDVLYKYRIDLWTMCITTLVVIFSAPIPKSPGGLVVRASD